MALPTLIARNTDGRLEIKDNPGLYWEFDFSFIVGGAVALYVFLSSPLSPWLKWASAAAAVMAIGVGVRWLMGEPASIVRLSRLDDRASFTRWTLFKRVEQGMPLGQVSGAKLEYKNDDGSGGLLRPVLVLSDGGTVPISMFWYKKGDAARAMIESVESYLGNPSHEQDSR
jgi:hypothetical protein